MAIFRRNNSNKKVEADTTSTSLYLETQKDVMNRVMSIRSDIQSIEQSDDFQEANIEEVLSGLFLARAQLLETDLLILSDLMNGRMGSRVSQVHKDFGEHIWKEIDELERRIQSKLAGMSIDFKSASALWDSALEIAKTNHPDISSFVDFQERSRLWITEERWNSRPPDTSL